MQIWNQRPLLTDLAHGFVRHTFGPSSLQTWPNQDHTSQDQFCSVINEFPVWNSKSIKPRGWGTASLPEREADLDPSGPRSSMIAQCRILQIPDIQIMKINSRVYLNRKYLLLQIVQKEKVNGWINCKNRFQIDDSNIRHPKSWKQIPGSI